MANLRDTFLSGVETLFSTFEEAVKTGVYTVKTDDGFNDATVITDTVRCIAENFGQADLKSISFSNLIQPSDMTVLMPYVDLVNCTITAQAYIMFDTEKYMVEAHDVDPMNVIFTLLLRKV